ncbi:GlcG/HbpS family heme-binding protein [Haliangium sp.]|uniref:GlcG/HbpS family heme-binding protein n=1 Tax=Haliangium sp. TaxID=2663208 RepID=UPI003D0BD0BB
MDELTFATPSVNRGTARRLIDAAAEHAVAIGRAMSIAICDEGGHLKAFDRMDGATLMSLDVAMRKARTSASVGAPTHTLQQAFASDAALAIGGPFITDIMLIPGGYPIVIGDKLVGGIGVSGGHYSQDQACAEEALRALGLLAPASP